MGGYDAGTRQHLLQKRQLTLQAAMDICRSDEAATAQMKSINDSAEIHKIKKSHSGDADKQNSAWKPGNLRSQRTMQRRQNATYSDGDTKRTCKFCGRAHPQTYVARHGGERVGDAGEETTSQTAARWETRRCIRWTGVDSPMKNPSWLWIKADTPKAQYTPKCG